MNQKKKVILSVTNDLATDQRVQKVAHSLLNMGFEVLLVGRELKGSLPVPHFRHHRMRLLFNKGVLFYTEYHLRLFFYLLVTKADLLVANDLDTLLPNFLISKLKAIPLVYDTHEYFTEVPELQENPFKKRIWTGVEQFIFPKLKKVITVNSSIAAIYAEKYGVPVHVIRNVPKKIRLNPVDKQKLKHELHIPDSKKIIVLQGSGINVSRGGEEAVEAMKYVSNAILYIIGSGDAIPHLKQMVATLQLEKSVVFKAKMPFQELIKYTQCADVGLTLDKDNNLNYKYSLPNKIFDYFACNIPVIASGLVEIRKIYEAFPFGILIQEVTAQNIAMAIHAIEPESDMYNSWVRHIKAASSELCWENEEKTLKQIYADLL